MSLLVSSMTTALRVNEICQQNGGLVYANPEQMGTAMGLFVEAPSEAQRNLREAVIAGLFMVPGAGIKGKQAAQRFRQDHPSGFKEGTNTLLRDQTTWRGKYAKVATQLGRYAVRRSPDDFPPSPVMLTMRQTGSWIRPCCPRRGSSSHWHGPLSFSQGHRARHFGRAQAGVLLSRGWDVRAGQFGVFLGAAWWGQDREMFVSLCLCSPLQ